MSAQAEGRREVNPSVSVLMAVYNGGGYLPLAMDSVLQQDFANFEFIIVDDCSTDRTAEIIRGYGDPRIVYERNSANLGQTRSLNLALSLARAPLVARIDADDMWAPGKLRRQVAFMEARPDIAVCGTHALRIDADGRTLGSYAAPADKSDIAFLLLRGVPLCHVSVVMRTDAVRAVGGYPEQYRFAADYALWSAFVRGGYGITNIPEQLTVFREMPNTFGVAQKAGPSGDETAAIIRANARDFAGVDLSAAAARDIALLYFPGADMSVSAIRSAYLTLHRLARGVYGKVEPRVRADLLTVVFWSVVRQTGRRLEAKGKTSFGRELRSVLRVFATRPAALLAAIAGVLVAATGERNAMRLKDSLAPILARLQASNR